MPDYATAIAATLRLLRVLEIGWSTRDELAAALGLHERSIRRMIDALRLAEVPIVQRQRSASTRHEYHVARARAV